MILKSLTRTTYSTIELQGINYSLGSSDGSLTVVDFEIVYHLYTRFSDFGILWDDHEEAIE